MAYHYQTCSSRGAHNDIRWVSSYTSRDEPEINYSTGRGGIRGIVELEILRQVQEATGGKIPIQAFFDLIVGTRQAVLSDMVV